MEFKNELNFKENDEIVVKSDNGDYKGNLQTISSDSLTMNNVVYLKTGVPLPGLRVYFKENVLSVKLIKNDESEKATNPRFPESILLHLNATHPQQPQAESHNEDMLQSLSELHTSYGKFGMRDFVLITRFDEQYHKCLSRLEDSKEFSVVFYLSEDSKSITWMAIDTGVACSLLYNIQALGNGVFQKGFKFLLESTEVMKVMYDCRTASHLLHTTYHTTLTNVFDLCSFDAILKSINKFNSNITPEPQSNSNPTANLTSIAKPTSGIETASTLNNNASFPALNIHSHASPSNCHQPFLGFTKCLQRHMRAVSREADLLDMSNEFLAEHPSFMSLYECMDEDGDTNCHNSIRDKCKNEKNHKIMINNYRYNNRYDNNNTNDSNNKYNTISNTQEMINTVTHQLIGIEVMMVGRLKGVMMGVVVSETVKASNARLSCVRGGCEDGNKSERGGAYNKGNGTKSKHDFNKNQRDNIFKQGGVGVRKNGGHTTSTSVDRRCSDEEDGGL